MNRLRKKWIALFLVITMFAGIEMPVSAATTTADYGALLDSYTAGSGNFQLTDASRMFVVSKTEPTGELLQTAQLINREFAAKGYPGNTPLALVWGPVGYERTGDIVLKLDTASDTGDEGYKLDVTATTATVTAANVDGLIYGANSLMKFFMVDGDMNLTAFTAADTPDTKERTVMLDTGRKYYTAEWICNFIRQISWMGYNSIQVHVSEDGGFRADFWDPTYYEGTFQPENDFTWLCGSHVQSWVKNGNKNNPNKAYRNDPDAGKYLSTADLVKICEVAKEYHIDIIPSFDSPAHMDYITWKFEQNYNKTGGYSFKYNGKTYTSTNGCINYTGRTGASSPIWPYYTTIDITDGTVAKAFVFALYEDIADFFKVYAGSTNFAIGADEVNLSTSNLASGYSFKWDYAKFPKYVNDLNSLLNDKGYTCRMFNDFIGSTKYNFNSSTEKCIYNFDDNIEIMYWNSDFNPTTGKWGKEAENQTMHVKFFWENNDGTTDNWGDGGRTIYNCIQTNCYYVLRVANAVDSTDSNYMKDARNPDNTNWTFYHSTEEDIYNEWYPADISEKGIYKEDAADVPADQLGGAYFLIWNDYAALNTEAEVWNGAADTTGTNNGETYYLFDRMYSNIIKMWNSDINSTVDYVDFKEVRELISKDYFPGFTSCSAAASLPEETELTPAYLTVQYLLEGSDSELVAESTVHSVGTDLNSDGTYELTISAIEGYKIVGVSEDVKLETNEDATTGIISGDVREQRVVAIYYKAILSELEILVEKAHETYTEQGNYTNGSWEAYLNALNAAEKLLEKSGVTQQEADECANALEKAISGLEKKATETEVAQLGNAIKHVEQQGYNQSDYTVASWKKYEEAISKANEMIANPGNYTSEEVNGCAIELTNAANSLVLLGNEPTSSISSIVKLTKQSRSGRPVGLLIKTNGKATGIVVKLGEELVTPLHLSSDKTKTFWLAKFYAPTVTEIEPVTFEYTVYVEGEDVGQTVDIEVVK